MAQLVNVTQTVSEKVEYLTLLKQAGTLSEEDYANACHQTKTDLLLSISGATGTTADGIATLKILNDCPFDRSARSEVIWEVHGLIRETQAGKPGPAGNSAGSNNCRHASTCTGLLQRMSVWR